MFRFRHRAAQYRGAYLGPPGAPTGFRGWDGWVGFMSGRWARWDGGWGRTVTLDTTPYFFTDFRFRAWTVAPRGGK